MARFPLSSSQRIAWAALMAGASALVLVIAATPLMEPAMRELMMLAFEPFCHQIPSRSFFVGDHQMAVGHRCFGIYLAVPFGVALLAVLMRWRGTIRRQTKWIVAAAGAPAALDWGLQQVGLWQNTPLTRVVTGFMLGLALGVVLGRAILDLAGEKQ